jgi:hypothetical protein
LHVGLLLFIPITNRKQCKVSHQIIHGCVVLPRCSGSSLHCASPSCREAAASSCSVTSAAAAEARPLRGPRERGCYRGDAVLAGHWFSATAACHQSERALY